MLVLGLAPDAAVSAAVQANVALCIWSEAQLRDIERAANALRKRAIVHVKVNSGMTRLGVDDERSLVALAKRLRECHDQGSVQWRGVFTHIACGDAEDAAPTLEQLERFSRAVDSVRNLNLMPSSTLVHAANSATSLRHAHGRLDMVRVGIALYGLAPCRDETPTPADVKPALSWFANIAQRRALQRGTPVSYGWTYRAQWDNELHLTLSVGYADGFRRCANNKVVIGGVVCDIVGRVTMDSIVARVPRGLEAHTVNATFAELLSENHTADDVARIWNTINYEVTCAIHKRVPQFHFHAD
jgi:alanine racemase